ncbi:MAG: hypothetical protein DDT18_01635 [Actinobacteria bacterium]|nr:hypothetical protein [Actinomycetota bacterium]
MPVSFFFKDVKNQQGLFVLDHLAHQTFVHLKGRLLDIVLASAMYSFNGQLRSLIIEKHEGAYLRVHQTGGLLHYLSEHILQIQGASNYFTYVKQSR